MPTWVERRRAAVDRVAGPAAVATVKMVHDTRRVVAVDRQRVARAHRVPGPRLQRVPGRGLHRVPDPRLQRVPAARLHRVPGRGLQRVPGRGLHRVPGPRLRVVGRRHQRVSAASHCNQHDARLYMGCRGVVGRRHGWTASPVPHFFRQRDASTTPPNFLD